MKCFIILFISLPLITIGQDLNDSTIEQSNFKNEISLNLFNITEVLWITNGTDRMLNANFVNGVKYKRHFGMNAIRIGLNYFSYEPSTENPNAEYIGQQKEIEFRIGYERKLTSDQFHVFIAGDLFYSYGEVSEYLVRYSNGDNPEIISIGDKIDYQIRKIGISPTLGINYRPFSRFSISIETNWDIAYFELESEDLPSTFNDFKIYFNYLGLLSANVHF